VTTSVQIPLKKNISKDEEKKRKEKEEELMKRDNILIW
jgi:hypothetical protein